MGDSGWAWECCLLGFPASRNIYETMIFVNLTARPATLMDHRAAWGWALSREGSASSSRVTLGSRAALG